MKLREPPQGLTATQPGSQPCNGGLARIMSEKGKGDRGYCRGTRSSCPSYFPCFLDRLTCCLDLHSQSIDGVSLRNV